MEGDRHEPHPDLSQLPAYLWRRSSRAVKITAGAALVAGIALGIALAPGIRESKEERALSESQAAARDRARRVRELRAEQRPVRGLLPGAGLEAAILADARRRDLRRPVIRVDCERLPPRPNRYACLAVTADIPAGAANEAGQIGYPYRAVADPASGRFALCKIAGRAGEGAISDAPVVPVPPACGGDR
ncbi:MAG TPA: hypothetical protein VHG69_08100 [Thermoleophilaceae bacterium]|nr:hypothetical protein [Thermoleophilaceae bacterium]